MSVNTETASAQGQTTVLEKEGVYASLFEKINLTPASSLGDINAFLDDAALSDAPAGERLTAAMQVFMDCIRKSGQPVEKLDKTLIDHHIAELDFQISRQLDAVMHHQEFQKVESLWRGLKQLVDSTDYRQNVKTEILDVSKEDLRQDFEDAPELIQSGLYQAEENLNALSDMLQRLELKHAAQLDALRSMMQNAAVRLENSENTGVSLPGNAVGAAELHLTEPTERCKRVYVVLPEPLLNKEPPVSVKQWKPFAAGMLSMLVAASVVAVGWQMMHAPNSAQMQLAASLAPIPEGLSTAQLQALQQTSPPPEPGISKTQQMLAQLLHLKPDWAVSYGDRLVQHALTLWPEEAKPLAQQWHKQISVAGLAESDLNGWHQGMTQLQQLTNRLNALDEQKGKYMTVSELKSAVFAMSQSFSHTVPLEEQLRLLSILPAGQPLSAAQLNQTEQHLQQLIASYALLKHQKE